MFDSFPRLIAVCHALHRLLAPRHPPHTLINLTTWFKNLKHPPTAAPLKVTPPAACDSAKLFLLKPCCQRSLQQFFTRLGLLREGELICGGLLRQATATTSFSLCQILFAQSHFPSAVVSPVLSPNITDLGRIGDGTRM